ncbi:phospholipase D-like domain-containing protein [Acinetobacter sp. HY1485]|uniref:phospholipase D-like domain-containing protein n=1 Tax=Acinetobacter sp. HY1485 TaxID=2970918 RepID=UPI0022B97659|nr:phospholipase D-like domain-containing protein [Acinetobacter sp. HY1485]
MQLSDFSINSIAPFITGDDGVPTPYLSGSKIIKFFNSFGVRDVYDDGLPFKLSRTKYVITTLKTLNGTRNLKPLLESLVDSRRIENSDEVTKLINEIIKYDGYKLEKNLDNIYRISGQQFEDPIKATVHFDEIKNQIIENLLNAKFCIWAAIAWFTDKDIGNILLNKHRSGLNIQVIVNDDEITEKYGLQFGLKGIEYYKVNPISPFGKKIMHNKFCIIDFTKVITGSYNWTKNATYNNENVSIIEGKDIAEQYAQKFIELKINSKYKNSLYE